MRLKRAIRTLLTGRDSRFFDDELVKFNLRSITPIADDEYLSKRLNIILPSLSASDAFGGLATQIELPIQIYEHGLEKLGWTIRFISAGTPPSDIDNLALILLTKYGIKKEKVSFVFIDRIDEVISISPNDVFLGSLWFCHLWAQPLMKFQLERFGGTPIPYISLLQDYEPNFYPWSSAFLLATGSYNTDWPKKVIFNSSELARYYKHQGHEFEDSAIFEPTLNYKMRDSLSSLGKEKKERRIIFYGRPEVRRNCFYIGREALEIWSERYEDSHRWKVISVGAKYAGFKLSGKVTMSVLGKLSIDEYIRELKRASVGLSLMSSPHPSYPPLEMANFGILTVSNSFQNKVISEWHENLRAPEFVSPDKIADILIDNCRKFESDPEVGLRGATKKPQYTKEIPDEKLDELVSMIIN